jgi:hypothetical protein
VDAKCKEKIGLFRYRLIAPLVLETHLVRGELTRRAREIAACKYDFPSSKRHAVSVDTLSSSSRQKSGLCRDRR